jgi:COMM domain containing 10
MSNEFIIETAQIKTAIELINNVPNEIFPSLLQRVSLKIHSNVDSSFKAEEIEKLEKTLNLSNESTMLVIDILEFILLQAAYELVKPLKLKVELSKINLSEEKTSVICELWNENGKEILEKIRKSKTISAKRLQNIKWRLNLQLATDLKTKQRAPNAIFEFNVNESATNSQKSFQVEFSKEQLYDFFLNLETIQKQIDSLNG